MQRLLDKIYQSLPKGADASIVDRGTVEDSCGRGAATYGEITPDASTRLIRWLRLGPKDCFVDCGSGVGRLTLQATVESKVGLAVGIEKSHFRHEVALRAHRLLDDAKPQLEIKKRALFVSGDFREEMPPNTTVIYAGSLCFPPILMESLARVAKASPGFRALCTLKKLPPSWALSFEELGEMDLEMTWSTNNRVYVYGRKRI